MRAIILYLTILYLAYSCSLSKQFNRQPDKIIEMKQLEGTVFYHFKNVSGVYFGTKTTFLDKTTRHAYSFMQNGHYSWADVCCQSAQEYCSLYGKDNHRLFKNYPQYENEVDSLYRDNPRNYYYSTAVYYCNDDSDIVLAFNVIGTGFLIKKACRSFVKTRRIAYSKARDCPFIIDNKELFNLPFVAMFELDTLYSLSVSEQMVLGLSPVPENRFILGFCD